MYETEAPVAPFRIRIGASRVPHQQDAFRPLTIYALRPLTFYI
jgi:hypothetical protein